MSRIVGIMITLFFGYLGVHRFMAGKIGTGILWLLTCGLFGLGWAVDFLMVCTGMFRTKSGAKWTK